MCQSHRSPATVFFSTLFVIFLWSLAVEAKSKMPKSIEMELFSREQICAICHAVLDRWKGQAKVDQHKFKEDLLTSCSLMPDPAEAKKCRERVTDAKVDRLRKEGAEEICVAEGMCGRKEFGKKMEEEGKEEERLKEKRRREEEKLRAEGKEQIPEVEKEEKGEGKKEEDKDTICKVRKEEEEEKKKEGGGEKEQHTHRQMRREGGGK